MATKKKHVKEFIEIDWLAAKLTDERTSEWAKVR